MRTKLSGRLVLVSMALIMGTVARSFAQDNTSSDSQGNAASGDQGISPTGEYKEGLAVGGWMLYPSLFVGGVYDRNFNQAPGAQVNLGDNGATLRVSPRLIGTYDDGGMHKTTIYGIADGQFFNADTIAATAGVTHTYTPTEDLILDFYGNYTRQTDIFNSALQFNNNAIGPPATANVNLPIILNPFGTTPSVNPIAYNQFTGSAAVTKTFDQAFMTVRGTAFDIVYDHSDSIPAPFQTTHDGASFWLSGRVGYNLAAAYVFAQGDGIFQRFNNSLFDTNGYRVIGGIGTNDANSLIKGEIYGGYQFQHQEQQNVSVSNPPQDVSGGVFGGRLTYMPTEYLTVVAQVDEIFGMATQVAPTVPQGDPTRTTTGVLQATYAMAPDWSVGGRIGYTEGTFIGVSGLNNNGWLFGASFNYEIWRNLLLTLDYQYTNVRSDAMFGDFTRNQYTAGLTYKY
jgi:hypothetical protein